MKGREFEVIFEVREVFVLGRGFGLKGILFGKNKDIDIIVLF